MSKKENQDFGSKLLNELMVDLLGALIPGSLFIIVVILSVVIPFVILSDGCVASSDMYSGGFWWVMLVVSLVFAYVVGHVFYRSDISVPDKKDVKKQINKIVKEIRGYSEEKLYQSLLYKITILKSQIEKGVAGEQWRTISVELRSALNKAIMSITLLHNQLMDKKNGKKKLRVSRVKKRDDKEIEYDENILRILFPEEVLCDKKISLKENLSENAKDVLKYYESKFRTFFCFKKVTKEMRPLYIAYSILHCQMEIGCVTEERCEFPYVYYYKYLLKRNMGNLLQYVDWHMVENRSKNKINNLKIQIQTFAQDAYAVINKNESHVRMSSSTWHTTKPLKIVTSFSLISLCIPIVIKCCQSSFCDTIASLELRHYFALILPFGMLFLVCYIRNRIRKYLHYQRMREILYTLQIYHQFEPIIRYRRHVMSGDYGKAKLETK